MPLGGIRRRRRPFGRGKKLFRRKLRGRKRGRRMLRRGTFRAGRSASKGFVKRVKAIAAKVVRRDRPANGRYSAQYNYFMGSGAGRRGRFMGSYDPKDFCATNLFNYLTNNASNAADPEDMKAAATSANSMWVSIRNVRYVYTLTNTSNAPVTVTMYSLGWKKGKLPVGSNATILLGFKDAISTSVFNVGASGTPNTTANIFLYDTQFSNSDAAALPGLDLLPNMSLSHFQGVKNNFRFLFSKRVRLEARETRSIMMKMPRYFWKYMDTAAVSGLSSQQDEMRKRLIVFYSQGALSNVDGASPPTIDSTAKYTTSTGNVQWAGTGVAINERILFDYSYGALERTYTSEVVVENQNLAGTGLSAPVLEVGHVTTLAPVGSTFQTGSVPVQTS